MKTHSIIWAIMAAFGLIAGYATQGTLLKILGFVGLVTFILTLNEDGPPRKYCC